MIRTRTAALGLTLLVAPVLAGCHVGTDASTSIQGASGNGTQFVATDIKIDNATLVAGSPRTGRAAFLGTVYNPTEAADAVVSIAVGATPARMLPDPIPLPPQQGTAIQTGKTAQADFTGIDAEPGQYVPVTMTFQNAGEAKFTALLVPPTGFYVEAAPRGTQLLEGVREGIKKGLEHQISQGQSASPTP